MIAAVSGLLEAIEVAYKCHVSLHIATTIAGFAKKLIGKDPSLLQSGVSTATSHTSTVPVSDSPGKGRSLQAARATTESCPYKTLANGIRYNKFLAVHKHGSRNRYAEDKRLNHSVQRLHRIYTAIAQGGRQLAVADVKAPYETLLSPDEMTTTQLMQTATKFALSPDLEELGRSLDSGFCAYCASNHIENANSGLVRIMSEIRPGSNLVAGRVDYQLTRVTNLMMDLPLPTAFRHIGTTLRQYDSKDTPGSYPSIEKSSLASPLGVALAVITRDEYILLTHRSHFVSCYSNRLGPSASGYADLIDGHGVGTTDTLFNVCAQTARKEAHEELSISIESSDITPLGLYREYLRTMPQAFLAVSVDKTLDEVILNARRRGGKAICSESQGLLAIKKSEFRNLFPRLIANSIPDCPVVGLEAQGLLIALAKHAPHLVGMHPQNGAVSDI